MHIALLVLILAIIIPGCNKEEYIEVRDYPRLNLNDRVVQDATGITFEAYIISKAGVIDDKGFVWDEGNGTHLNNGSNISLGPGYESGTFTATIDYGVEAGLSYELRAYIISEGRTIYSKREYFISSITGTE